MTYTAPIDDMLFNFFDVFDGNEIAQIDGWEDITHDFVKQVLEAAGEVATNFFEPCRLSGHEAGLTFDNGTVTTPKEFKDAYRAYVDGGWHTLVQPQTYGGQGIPYSVSVYVQEMLCGSNMALSTYPHLGMGAALLVYKTANEDLKQTYLPRMIAGDWLGTMCLTEAHCGTDLGQVRTKAEAQEDGSYKLTGQKIFISAGEHDLTENIVHTVLARVPGGPKGIKGLSLFLVPKYLANPDGSLGNRNPVNCSAIEHKMGINASATAVLDFDGAKGFLLGELHKGIEAMFYLMNNARVGTGIYGLGVADAAHQGALAYAADRLQGRSLRGKTNPDGPADPIIVHGDVRRMLLEMRAWTEGSRALVTWVAQLTDFADRHPDADKRKESANLVGLLTPVVKAFITDQAFETTVLGQQVLGGHGYIREHGMEQHVRDVRITQIWEGTNSIQALDLVGRKFAEDGGATVKTLMGLLGAQAAAARAAGAEEFAAPLDRAMQLLGGTLQDLMPKAMKDPEQVGTSAKDILNITGLAIFAYLWSRAAITALPRQDEPLCRAKVNTARVYLQRLFPRIEGFALSAAAPASLMMDVDDTCL